MELLVHFCTPLVIETKSDPATDKQLAEIDRKLNHIMATLADLQAAVAAENSVIDSAVTLIKGLADKVAALAPDQAAIDALAAEIKGKSDALSAAVSANTPADPAAVPAPAPAPVPDTAPAPEAAPAPATDSVLAP